MTRPGRRARLHAWVALARLSNAPTVVTNAAVGVAIGLASSRNVAGPAAGSEAIDLVAWPGGTFAAVAAALLLLYVAGMFLNDVADARIDRTERPERPIPSGRVRASAAGIAGVVLLLAGLSLLVPFPAPARVAGVLLVLAIVGYDILHKRTRAAALLMGACRGLAYAVAAFAVTPRVDPSLLGIFAASITLYVVVLTLVARLEARAPRKGDERLRLRQGVAPAALGLTAVLPSVLRPGFDAWWTIAAGLLLLAWLALSTRHLRPSPPRVGRAVGDWLAGICLIDAFYLTLLDRPLAAAVAVGCFGLTVLGHRVVSGT